MPKVPAKIIVRRERIDLFSNTRKIITPESCPLCSIAQEGNVPRHRPFLAVNVAGDVHQSA